MDLNDPQIYPGDLGVCPECGGEGAAAWRCNPHTNEPEEIPCLDCLATGRLLRDELDAAPQMICPHCRGQGQREGPLGRLPGEFYADVQETCPSCFGSGNVLTCRSEREARFFVQGWLPRGLRWLVDKPRLLRWYVRLPHRYKPEQIVEGNTTRWELK